MAASGHRPGGGLRLLAAIAALALGAGLGEATVLAQSSGSRIMLDASPTRVLLAAPEVKQSRVSLADRLRSLLPGQRMLLLFSDLSAEQEPGTTWAVYLDLPPGTAPKSGEPGYVGDINFFGVRARAGGGAARALSFDVTTLLGQLDAAGRSSQPITLTLVPQGRPPAGASPSIGQIKLVEQ